MGLMPDLARAAGEKNYLQATPIQQAAIPAILQGCDVQGSAPTGSGKTAAFALPLLQAYSQSRHEMPRKTQTLILLPTRELAIQVADSLAFFARHLPHAPKIITLVGGVALNPQLMVLRGGADIVLATPGRLLDVLAHNALRLNHVKTLVLDEADRLLELGFSDEVSQILALLPAKRQNLLFSATFPPGVKALTTGLLQQAVLIDVPASLAAPRPAIRQRALTVDTTRRTALLRHLIASEAWQRTLVFVASQHGARHLAEKLVKAGLRAEAFHGELSQGRRNRVLAEFQDGKLQVLVATDVAARGLDIAALDVVVNYDLPRASDDYTHRIGRTGRAGASGLAISFVTAQNEAHFYLIEKRQQQRVAREQIAGFEPEMPVVTPAKAVADDKGGIKGKRMSKKDKLRAAQAAGSSPDSTDA
ncbi:DEAD/DEAH box helicase [Aquitalea sp. S1-19]|nr:DEAD/DEAH box helicase [Aquitalea sp. S1-19]